MSDTDQRLANTLRRAMPKARKVPGFKETWNAAEARADQHRRRFHYAAAAAVGALAIVVVANLPAPPGDALAYIDMAELENSTYWSAPSDALLPESRFDIYQDMPTLFESTEAYGGALL